MYWSVSSFQHGIEKDADNEIVVYVHMYTVIWCERAFVDAHYPQSLGESPPIAALKFWYSSGVHWKDPHK